MGSRNFLHSHFEDFPTQSLTQIHSSEEEQFQQQILENEFMIKLCINAMFAPRRREPYPLSALYPYRKQNSVDLNR